VLVPDRGAMGELQHLIGPEWVRTYAGELSPAVLVDALEWSRRPRAAVAPLESLSWPRIAEQTVDFYHLVGAR